ncbi:MAG: NFACT family protein [Cyanophyceae cyanobacterium]
MQSVDYTTLRAACVDLRRCWLPARIEQVYQRDRTTVMLALRTTEGRGWLTLCWHPQGARICLGDPPPRSPDTFTFSDQLRHQLGGLALTAMIAIASWERVVDLQFAKRPGESPRWHLYVEVMGKYSNVILTDAHGQIVTAAHQVSAAQSSLRTVQTGQLYEPPPPLMGTIPDANESCERWQERVSLIPGAISRQLLKSYRGLSPALARSMVQAAHLDPQQATASLQKTDWQRLFARWQEWLQALATERFSPGWTEEGYTVMGWEMLTPADTVQTLLNRYYTDQLNQQVFQQLRHQLGQKVKSVLSKLRQKAKTFVERLQQSDDADQQRHQADLLMAHLHEWKPGLQAIVLTDFNTGQPVKIALNPEKNAVQNAQALYKRHQKLKRARVAVAPLLEEANQEIVYLEQIESMLDQTQYQSVADLETLEEIREELIEQHYLEAQRSRSTTKESEPYRYFTPSGFQLWVGRNNRQNERLTRIAGDYDLWFHAQEIAGSHVLLRLEPGAVPDETDLQFAADLAAYYSRGRQSNQIPVVYTEPKHVYKPKGAKPGMVLYKQERIVWGHPQQAVEHLTQGIK